MDTSTHFSSGRNLKYKLFDNPQGCAVIRRYIKCDGAGLYHERSKVIEGMAADSFRTECLYIQLPIEFLEGQTDMWKGWDRLPRASTRSEVCCQRTHYLLPEPCRIRF